jgi:hypothetical protein
MNCLWGEAGERRERWTTRPTLWHECLMAGLGLQQQPFAANVDRGDV